MNLIDENIERESEEKQKKLTKVIIFAIIILVLLAIVIVAVSFSKKKNTLKCYIENGNKETASKNVFKKEMFLMADSKHLYVGENGQIYVSVRNLATELNVEFYNDEYKGKGEDTSKCYIKTDNEYTSYLSDSNTIYKVRDNKKKNEELIKAIGGNNKIEVILPDDYEYEYFTVKDGVKYVDGEIYASQQAIRLGFNVDISYDDKNKTVKIYTLDVLQENANSKVGDIAKIEQVEYYNKKLLKYGLVLIRNSDGRYGITDYVNYKAGVNIVSCKYSDVKFIENLGYLIVTDAENGKQGLLKLTLGQDKGVKIMIHPVYQEIHQVNNDGSLYIIRENDKYGILKISENEEDVSTETILKPEYQLIGVPDYSKYEDLENRYIINEKYIPVKSNEKWGIVSTEGRVLISPKYDYIGCNLGNNSSGSPVICVPNLVEGQDAIVFGNIEESTLNGEVKKVKYELIDMGKKSKIGYDSIEIYSVTDNGKKVYYTRVVAADGNVHKLDVYKTYGVEKKSESKPADKK